MKAMLGHIKIGNPADPSVSYGPLIREVARKRTEDYVAIAQDEGATLVAGGKRPDGFDKGFFYEPTLFDNVKNDSRLAQEEVFGPIGAVIDRKSTRLNPVTNAHLVCRLLLEKKKIRNT